MSRLFASVATCLMLLAVISCSDDNNSPTGPSGPTHAYPLAMGNWWAYHTEAWLGGTSPFFEDYDTILIDTTFTRNGLTWFGEKDGEVFYANDSTGVRQLTVNTSHPTGAVDMLYRYPASVGERWTVTVDTLTYQVLLTNDARTVAAGTFSGCYKYQVTDASNDVWREYMKPGVGMLMIDALDTLMGVQWGSKVELTAYHIQ